MSERDEGGPAFPQSQHVGDIGVTEGGMTLRDYFAAKAMQSFSTKASQWETREALSRDAYAMADAMLAHRDTDTTER